jgi:soluble lytic murein transglycosylase-like protein
VKLRISDSSRTSKPKLLVLALALSALLAAAFAASSGPALAGTGGLAADEREATKSHSGNKYDRLWNKTSRKNKRWARRTAECESGGNPRAIGGGGKYRGAFQFLKSTWRASPKSPGGDPIKYRYKVQAVVAVRLKMRDGRGHWPNCG